MWVFEPVLFLVYFSFLWKCVERISVLSIKQWNEDQIRRNVRYYSNILLSRVIPILLHSDCVKLLYVIVSVDMVGIWDLVCVCVCAGRICIHSHVLPTKQHSFDNVNCVLYVCVRFFFFFAKLMHSIGNTPFLSTIHLGRWYWADNIWVVAGVANWSTIGAGGYLVCIGRCIS